MNGVLTETTNPKRNETVGGSSWRKPSKDLTARSRGADTRLKESRIVELEDGILRLGCGRDADLRNLLKFGDGGWCSPVNSAFGVLGEPSDGANGTPRLRRGPVYIVRGGRCG